jgi:hypothetical protein
VWIYDEKVFQINEDVVWEDAKSQRAKHFKLNSLTLKLLNKDLINLLSSLG